MHNFLEVSKEVQDAIQNNLPVVALESTIISHGMPYPKNAQTALEVERTVRENGAVPATIAIIKGKLKVGISSDEIEYLGKCGTRVAKISRRDIPVAVANEMDGATTVAGTMLIANLAKIKIFATGGIGGVHRNAQQTWDISCDLEELANTPVMVICAGAKAILDLALTKEYLETKGVPLLGYNTDKLPAFFTRACKLAVDKNVKTPLECARIAHVGEQIGLKNGFVVANPILHEYSMDEEYIESIIVAALKEADENKIEGKEITPFLLDKIQKLTKGSSLDSNIKLVLNNVALGSKIAKEYCNLRK